MMTYRDNMTASELAEFMHEIKELEELYKSVDWGCSESSEDDDEYEDEMQLLRRAALDCRGRP